MTPAKILEIARRYTAPEEEISILLDDDGKMTGETLTLRMWNFCEEELLAFAQSVIEEERDDEPFAWAVFDGEGNWDLFQYAMNENLQKEFLDRHPDPMYKDWVVPLFRRQAYGIGEEE